MTTLDPASLPPSPRRTSAGARVPVCLRILFHPDLSRVGDELELDGGAERIIGRSSPDFADATGRQAPIADPYVSREHFAVRATASGQVELRPLPGVRLPVLVLEGGPHAAARPLAGPCPVPLGSLVRLGDRVLLAVDEGGGPTGSTLVGRSGPIRRLVEQVAAVARFHEPVLVLGETGCGKELVARAIHDGSGVTGRFVGLNTAGLDEGTAASELFGHTRGAFTGAADNRAGVFEAARNGTLFLDDIGDMSAELQRKLLRVLETRRFARLGSHDERPVETRIVAATHRPLLEDIEAGGFRRDLFERLRALTVTVPALRERLVDVPLLFAHFLRRLAADRDELRWLVAPADPAAASPLPLDHVLGLLRFSWPGNVRELRNHVTALAAANLGGPPFRPGPELTLPSPGVERSGEPEAGKRRASPKDLPPDADVAEALRIAGGRVQDAAEALGASRFQVYRWLHAQGKRPADFA